jgi:hypothetical protein
MNTVLRSVALPALFAITLAGCASVMGEKPRAPTTQDCTGECRVNVSITCVFVMFCKVSVPDEVYAHGQNIFWDVDHGAHPSFQFDPVSGIEFKTEEGRRNFSCQVLAGGRSFKCDNAKAAGKYEYSVKVIGVPRLDPWIVN